MKNFDFKEYAGKYLGQSTITNLKEPDDLFFR